VCTVTFVGDSDRLVLTMNRDDANVRVEAPPREAQANEIAYLAPIDVRTGGTWIGVNAHGIGACLLNRYDPAPPPELSRGLIVPEAMGARDAHEAVERVSSQKLTRFAPFACLVLSRAQCFRMDWNGAQLESKAFETAPPWMTTSAGLADVRKHREDLFEHLIAPETSDVDAALSAFHSRRDVANDRAAPLMLRDAWQTMSITQVSFNKTRCDMRYWSRESALARGLTNPDFAGSI
jgi:uncharacterized protein with NRDE domain